MIPFYYQPLFGTAASMCLLMNRCQLCRHCYFFFSDLNRMLLFLHTKLSEMSHQRFLWNAVSNVMKREGSWRVPRLKLAVPSFTSPDTSRLFE